MMRSRLFFQGILCLLISCACTSCYTRSCLVPISNEEEEIHAEATEVINMYAYELAKDEGLSLCNAYVKKMYWSDGEYWAIWVDFETYRLVDIPEARHLLVHIVEGLLKKVNHSDGLKLLIGRPPIEKESIYVSVEFKSYFGRYIDPMLVGRMEFADGYWSKFYAHTSFDDSRTVFHTQREPYGRTLQIVTIEDRIAMREKIPEEELGLVKEKEDVFIDLFPSTFTNYPKDIQPRRSIGVDVDEDLDDDLDDYRF